MRRVNLDLNDPEACEGRARAEGHRRGVTSAVLKVSEFASDIEASKASKAADASSRRTPTSPAPFWQQRRGRTLNALTDELELTAVDTPTPPPPPPGLPPPRAPPGLPAPETRSCYACGRQGDLVMDCRDAAKLAAWKANAPKRLSRDKRQVAAMFFAMAQDEDISWAPEDLRGASASTRRRGRQRNP
ncbi:hypothetical protein CYMTET_24262 [Cymbomonas tetramitiformis]|uniref:Uncharacterized protein n=1 Tax=Cymbomonas tetramitiformis TaxID=36881 RepID=A0AAE0L027_9CHLO|nr:hypothetical protein CYMTET_24262 [Cymbomonas tetramitiformis]